MIASIFTGKLDSETTKLPMQKGIYGNYAESRKTISTMQVKLADFGASDPMGLRMCKTCQGDDDDDLIINKKSCGKDSCASCTPTGAPADEKTNQEAPPEIDAITQRVLDAVGNGEGNGGKGGIGGAGQDTVYHNCKEKGHFARDCPKPPTQETLPWR